MHNRRLGALLIGMWLMGSVLAWFVKSQTLINVDRFLANAPPQLEKTIAAVGKDSADSLLRAQALQASRHLQETWDVVQVCLGGALFLTSLLTSNRSRVIIACSAAMLAMVAAIAFYLTPNIDILLRMMAFGPRGETVTQAEDLASLQVWRRVLEVLKMGTGLVIVARLLFAKQELETAVVSSRSRRSRAESDISPLRARARQ